jgi:hypothetical protein
MSINRFGVNSAVSELGDDQERVTMGLGLAFQKLRHFLCGLHGHEPLLQFDRGRIFLQCASCGFESSGWEVGGEAQARRRTRRSSTRYSTHLADVRKVA